MSNKNMGHYLVGAMRYLGSRNLDVVENDDIFALMEPSGDLRVLRDEMTGHELLRYVAESE